jgi:hypothetical protein
LLLLVLALALGAVLALRAVLAIGALNLDLRVLLLLVELLLLTLLHCLVLLLLVLVLHLLSVVWRELYALRLGLGTLSTRQGESATLEASRCSWSKLLLHELLCAHRTATLTTVDLRVAAHWWQTLILWLLLLLLLIHAGLGLYTASPVRGSRDVVLVVGVGDRRHSVRTNRWQSSIVNRLLLLLLLLLLMLLLLLLLLLLNLLWLRLHRRKRLRVPRHLSDSTS